METAAQLGVPVVEFHTGPYTHATGAERARELARLADAASLAHRLGLECHAGHGLDYETVVDVAALPELAELNIGHFLVGEAIFSGLSEAILRMRLGMAAGRQKYTK